MPIALGGRSGILVGVAGEELDDTGGIKEPVDTVPAGDDVRHAVSTALLDRFFAESGLSAQRRSQADEMLTVEVDVFDDGSKSLRVKFAFAGATSWWAWDGTIISAKSIGDELGHAWACDAIADQRHGPTGWEPEFDDPSA